MKILVAPDSFKGSLSALEVALALERGLKRANRSFQIEKVPLADGGEGTVQSLVAATAGRFIKQVVTGPLGNQLEASFGILSDGKTAVIEMAAASGLPLIPEEKRNPLITTTFGTGELIKAGLDQGCDNFIIGIGGSATNDGGIGMAQALGANFLDVSGCNVGFGGGELIKIEKIDLSGLDQRLNRSNILVACDVSNPLYGETGAAYIYGPQKGANREIVEMLDRGLRHLAKLINRDLGVYLDDFPGTGAAGGLGAGLMAFLQAELKPGIEIILAASKIEEKLPMVDLVITGEGTIDSQTIFGKTSIGLARLAKKYSLPVVGIAGALGFGATEVYEQGIDALFSIIDAPMDLPTALAKAPFLIETLGENIGRLIMVSKEIR